MVAAARRLLTKCGRHTASKGEIRVSLAECHAVVSFVNRKKGSCQMMISQRVFDGSCQTTQRVDFVLLSDCHLVGVF